MGGWEDDSDILVWLHLRCMDCSQWLYGHGECFLDQLQMRNMNQFVVVIWEISGDQCNIPDIMNYEFQVVCSSGLHQREFLEANKMEDLPILIAFKVTMMSHYARFSAFDYGTTVE